MRGYATVGAALLGLVGGEAFAQAPRRENERFVAAARELLGIPYQFGGRMRRPDEGIDCQGVLFYAAERVGRCGWKSFSVFPTQSIPSGELGPAVEGLAPIASSELELSRLEPGDVLLLVGFDSNPAEPHIGKLKERPVWVWHTGIYSGGGRWIVGDHFASQVVEVDLAKYLADHSDVYAGLVVTRMKDGPHPRQCRQHRPMRAPKASGRK